MSTRTTLRSSLGLARDRLRRAPRHLLIALLLQAAVILIVGRLIPGVLVADPLSALFAALVIGVLNALVRPVLVVLTLPLTVATFGLISLLINTTIVVIAAPLVPGLDVEGFLAAFSLAIVLTIATTAINVILAVEDDEGFYRELARRVGQSDAPVAEPGQAGLVIIQIDGLAAPILANAVRVGLVPRFASWVRSGAYRLVEWECPPPSQTSASQAGILLGDNAGIPAFRWYEKRTGRLLVSNRPADAAEIERRLSTGEGLLNQGGSSIGNLFSGEATRNAFVMSRMTDPVAGLDVDAFSLYFLDPAAFIRTVMLSVSEFVKELIEARRQRNQDIQPRVHRGTTFAFLRAATNVVLRDLNTTFVVRSMALGVPVIYVDFTDYDEIAHHAGPERLESLRALTGIDRVVASLERAARGAPRDYRFVLLSDHGQSQGATFLQRYGQTLEALVRELMGGDPATVAATSRSETFGPVNALLTEIAGRPGVTGRVTGRAFRSRTSEGSIELGREATDGAGGVPDARPELVVCASGNLANIYLTASDERMTAEEMEQRYPGLLAGLASHPGIGLVMVRSATGSSLVLGPAGVRHLDDDRVEGADPLAALGERAGDHLRRLDGFEQVGDLLVNSVYDADLEEVAAFEELVGSHGGMGGPQNRPFLLAPAELAPDPEPLVGAPAVHQQLRAWRDALGIRAPAVSPGSLSAPVSRPRGLPLVAAYLSLTGIGLALLGLLLLWGAAADTTGEILQELGGQARLVGVVLTGVGLAGLLTAWGIWRRRRWAWMAALAFSTLSVLQVVFALASGGLGGIVSYGLLSAGIALAMFFYLTRPHVAAAFGRSRGGTSARSPGVSTSDHGG